MKPVLIPIVPWAVCPLVIVLVVYESCISDLRLTTGRLQSLPTWISEFQSLKAVFQIISAHSCAQIDLAHSSISQSSARIHRESMKCHSIQYSTDLIQAPEHSLSSKDIVIALQFDYDCMARSVLELVYYWQTLLYQYMIHVESN